MNEKNQTPHYLIVWMKDSNYRYSGGNTTSSTSVLIPVPYASFEECNDAGMKMKTRTEPGMTSFICVPAPEGKF